jgi:1-acyl-sn-glycerol-3-phosphate acyltransferase
LAEGRDVAVWPGGEVDSLRPWVERDRANLAGRKGFITMAIRAGVPIVPIATVGGADAMPVLMRGDGLSRALRLDKVLRLKVFPLAVSLPWGIAPAALPQLPMPAKIRTRFMPAIEVDTDAARADAAAYVSGNKAARVVSRPLNSGRSTSSSQPPLSSPRRSCSRPKDRGGQPDSHSS